MPNENFELEEMHLQALWNRQVSRQEEIRSERKKLKWWQWIAKWENGVQMDHANRMVEYLEAELKAYRRG